MIKAPQEEICYQVLHLGSWPALPHLLHDADAVPNLMRICALLARRPSVGILIPVMLDIPPPLARSLLEALYAKGYIYPAAAPLPDLAAAPGLEPTQSREAAKTLSFVNKIWLRLITKK